MLTTIYKKHFQNSVKINLKKKFVLTSSTGLLGVIETVSLKQRQAQ